MSTMLPYGNLSKLILVTTQTSLSQIAANTTGERTFVLPGVMTSSDIIISITCPGLPTGLGIVGARIASDGVVGVALGNFTAAPITPNINATYNVLVARLDVTQANFS